ncbi:hypothetical protein P4O66_017008 [Electrophorus voltai]|uniref:Amphiphysin n=1 Tax=Electrophorus voltai TaxID=2609070 RepID=A0AAD9DLC8_9TELE|nr:hypothetical protein P4O66_017008 [Electrophorus voltai]
MAEIKTGIFAKNVQKRLSRAQEKHLVIAISDCSLIQQLPFASDFAKKASSSAYACLLFHQVLQKLGKADETKDEQFEQCVLNFKRQETEGSRLQREMKAYIAAVKGMQQASMNLTESLHEVYEPDWHGKDDVMSIGKNCDALWEDFHQKLVDSTLAALDTYLAQFPDIKVRVAKRSRKLIDYDSARHHLETLQVSGIKNDKKIAKAEEDLKKAQKVFDDLNVDLQDELPTLWDSRVGFYVNTFKTVSSLEAKFHKEISFLCHKLYEVMIRLADQHSDKMFTIQGAPSDSGPLRLARTPTPPEDESPECSPVASPNHTLRPTSPGPPRPKSPSQVGSGTPLKCKQSEDLKIGPPKPPPPKVTPNKEVAQEQIIDLFDRGFSSINVTLPQMSEKLGESLLDLDFDPFKPDSNTAIGQTQLPAAQVHTCLISHNPLAISVGIMSVEDAFLDNSPPAFPNQAPDAGFTANWKADFGSTAEDVGGVQPSDGGQGWPPAEGWPTEAAPQEEAAPGEVRSWDKEYNPEPNFDCEPCAGGCGKAQLQPIQSNIETGWAAEQTGQATDKPGEAGDQVVATTKRSEERGATQSIPGIIFTYKFGQEIPEATEVNEQETTQENNSKWHLASQGDTDGSKSEYETTEEWGDSPGQNRGANGVNYPGPTENEGPNALSNQGVTNNVVAQKCFSAWGTEDMASPFPDQSTDQNATSFGGRMVLANCDQVTIKEPVKPNKAMNLVKKSSPGSSHGTTKPTQSKQQQENINDSVLDCSESTLTSDPFGFLSNDPFGKDNYPFGTSGSDPFGTGNDPFANSDKGHFGPPETDPFELFLKDVSDQFGTSGSELFDPLCSRLESKTTGFALDPCASQAGTGGWTSHSFSNDIVLELFASETNQGWAGNWEPTSTGGAGGEGTDLVRQSNRPSQWASFPPLEAGPESSSKGSWQEMSNIVAFSDGQGDFIVSWSSDGGKTQDLYACLPGHNDMANPKTTATENQASPKETDNSDLSEDEVANRRYGKLYQEIDTEKDEMDASHTAFVADFDKMSPAESPATADTDAEEQAKTTPDDVTEKEQLHQEVPAISEDKESPIEETPEKMPIPSVVIEPASSNEGDDDRDGDITSPTAGSGNEVTPDSQTAKDISSGMPPGFKYKASSANSSSMCDHMSKECTRKSSYSLRASHPNMQVETMHDFEAANLDELNLKKGDIVLVVPTELVEDQDAGWLTGIKESDWLQHGASAQKGLFPENFTQHMA